MTQTWPEDVPEWVKTWAPPETPKDWAWDNRILLYRYAMELYARGPVTTGFGRGRGVSPQEIMTNTAKQFTLARLKKHLKGFAEHPIFVLPKTEKIKTTKREIFSPGPAFNGLAPMWCWAHMAALCYPEHDDSARIGRLCLEIETKLALSKPKPITAPWKSYWVCSRSLVKLAMAEWDLMVSTHPGCRDIVEQLGGGNLFTPFQCVMEGRSRGYAAHAPGADSGVLPDSDFLPDGTWGDRGSESGGGSALSPDDDGLLDRMEAVDE